MAQERRFDVSAENLHTIKWSVDVAFAVHPDFKSHTGAVMTFDQGAIQTQSRKQKLNTRSSTEAELVGGDDAITMILWTKHFMEALGYEIKHYILYQDNKSTILLHGNGRQSAGKQSRALNVGYFFLSDQISKGNLMIEYMTTCQSLYKVRNFGNFDKKLWDSMVSLYKTTLQDSSLQESSLQDWFVRQQQCHILL
jgi:hypothetical protein